MGGATNTGGTPGMGGTSPSGDGTKAIGGTLTIGGSASAAGSSSTTAAGGTSSTATGGTSSTAAVTTAGGTVAAGGATKAGGASNTGGTPVATGGHSTTGGMTAGGATTAGASTTGGTQSAGGTAGTGTSNGGGTSAAGATACPKVDFGTWTSKKDPLTIGNLALSDFKTNHLSDDYGGAGYSLAFTWYGALRFSKLQDIPTAELISGFDSKLAKSPPSNATGVSHDDNGPGATVDDRAFGVLPLEIYIEQVSGDSYLKLGMDRANTQWSDTNPQTGEPYNFRYWADDMYMITALQVQAYRAAKITPSLVDNANVYLVDHAAAAMKKYITALQQRPDDNSIQKSWLFWHTKNSQAYWGRANGWIAAGMTELLIELPAADESRVIIMTAFQHQMDALLDVQIKKGDVAGDADVGCWRQVLDLTTASAETSCTAMFTYALVNAVKNGWLTGSKYVDAAHNGWACIANKIHKDTSDKDDGKLSMVCPGTGAAKTGDSLAKQQAFYSALVDPNKPPAPGDLHGQAPLLWAATALLRTDCPGLR